MPLLIKSSLLFSVIVIPLVLYRRQNDPDVYPGWFSEIRITLIIIITSLFAFIFTPWLLGDTYRYITDPAYEATVIEIIEKENDEGGKMYSKVFEFIDNQGKTHKITSSLSSGGKPTIGNKEKITYADGVLLELSVAGIMLTLGGLITIHLISLIPLYFLLYAINLYPDIVLDYASALLLKVLIPLIMGLLTGVFLYNLWLGLSGAKDIPFWAMMLMSIFSFFMLFSMWGMLKMFWVEGIQVDPFKPIRSKK